MKNSLIAAISVVLASGCVSTGDTKSVITMGGTEYAKDETGNVVMTRQQYQELSQKEDVVFVETVGGEGIELTQEELEVAKEHGQVLFDMMGQGSGEGVASLLKVGSLQENLRRIVKENGWKDAYFEGPDFYVKDISVVEEVDLETLVLSITSEYPSTYSCVDKNDRIVTVIDTTQMEDKVVSETGGVSK